MFSSFISVHFKGHISDWIFFFSLHFIHYICIFFLKELKKQNEEIVCRSIQTQILYRLRNILLNSFSYKSFANKNKMLRESENKLWISWKHAEKYFNSINIVWMCVCVCAHPVSLWIVLLRHSLQSYSYQHRSISVFYRFGHISIPFTYFDSTKKKKC